MLLYLDIDGVMVPANSWRKLEVLDDGFSKFSSQATDSLNRIISTSDAGIVLTTSHKHRYTLPQWDAMFKRRGIITKNISRLPPNTKRLTRNEELIRWFEQEDRGDEFLIIDDDKSLNALPQYLKQNLIQPSASVGLTTALCIEAMERILELKYEVTD